MPRNIIHSDVSAEPETESEALSIAPDAEDEPEVEEDEEEVEVEVEGDEGAGEGEDEDEDGDEPEEGDEGDEPEEEDEDEEPADDGDGDGVQESDLDELSSPSISPPPAQTTPSRSSRLKITLKLPTQPQKPPRVHRAVPKDKDLDSDIESEDDDDDIPRSGNGKRPLTTRQAVLASVVGSSHVALDETSRKKKQLNEAEIALRREETARKRKHLSEKKLEDEKVRVYSTSLRNHLASAEDRTPATHTGNGTPAEGEIDEEESGEVVVAAPVVEAPPGNKMFLSFSVPASILPMPQQPALDGDGDTVMAEHAEQLRKPLAPAVCDIDGCTAKRKYRLVRDWERGACGMDHLHLLEKQRATVAI
ncbi:hypothetical protein F5148DRAFT_1276325 [Russula earlei]|uniref:Uncharacterized protein n=1 Tax=Russula earlei TaxID=71964 RepID=A0ACC0U7H8_9AGAM|nr:hypothetical protein F5148DRAFT_1276325 [Russula earlei]